MAKCPNCGKEINFLKNYMVTLIFLLDHEYRDGVG